jgi:hypothetical protein
MPTNPRPIHSEGFGGTKMANAATKTYACRSICDHDCVFEFAVTKRTGDFVSLQPKHGNATRRKVFNLDGVEALNPFGTYSMAPVLRAA